MKIVTSFFLLYFSWISITIAQPLDDIVERKLIQQRKVLKYPPLREVDVFWSKKVWRVIDFREKINQNFKYENAPFFKMLTTAILRGEILAYDSETEDFTLALDGQAVKELLFKTDTTVVFDPVNFEEEIAVVHDELDWRNINRLKIKEIWYLDTRTSRVKVRILGMAPMVEVKDQWDKVKYEKPLFWIHYPQSRSAIAKFYYFNTHNSAARLSWEDILEMRYFSSYIIKAENVQNDRLTDLYSGLDALLEADKIKQEIFNFEQDLWSY